VSHVKPTSPSIAVDVYQHLLAICSELVSKNKVIKLDRLFNIARREMQVDSATILKGIKRLEDDQIIKADSKLLRSELLHNDTRKELYFIILRNPGISFNQIRSQMGKGTKLLLWHVEVLSDFGCIRSYTFESNASAYYTRHVDEADWGREGLYMFQLYQNATVKKILDMLSDGSSYAIKQIEERLGISRQLVEYHVKKLQDKHVVDAIDEASRLYFLVDMQRRLFLKCKEYKFHVD
jgi:DNA-binding Lrp family transcriptional regulator